MRAEQLWCIRSGFLFFKPWNAVLLCHDLELRLPWNCARLRVLLSRIRRYWTYEDSQICRNSGGKQMRDVKTWQIHALVRGSPSFIEIPASLISNLLAELQELLKNMFGWSWGMIRLGAKVFRTGVSFRTRPSSWVWFRLNPAFVWF